jgi:23S rRNA pseudouridine2605 synthase
MAAETRLNKYIAYHTGISRRQADDLIASGRARINLNAVSLGYRLQPNDSITIDDKPVLPIEKSTTILLNKPVGYVCSRRRQGDTPTIYELLPETYHSLKPVGRLDKDSSGILLLTNDGDLAHQMTHPSFHKTKIYEVAIDQPLQPLHRQMISDFGVNLEDGNSKFQLERLSEGDDQQWRITMSEGRNRQIRRTFAALGYTVTRLHRTNFGIYSLSDLGDRQFRQL